MKTNTHALSHLAQTFLQWEVFQTKVVQITKPHILCSILLFSKIVLFYDVMWKNTVDPDRPKVTIWRMRTACWINKGTNTHSE